MFPWHRTDRLVLDREGLLWLRAGDALRRLGPVAEAEVPAHLEAEASECLDHWRDAFDGRAAQEWAYRLSVFGR